MTTTVSGCPASGSHLHSWSIAPDKWSACSSFSKSAWMSPIATMRWLVFGKLKLFTRGGFVCAKKSLSARNVQSPSFLPVFFFALCSSRKALYVSRHRLLLAIVVQQNKTLFVFLFFFFNYYLTLFFFSNALKRGGQQKGFL